MDDTTTQNVTEGFGLMYYNARMYDPALGRFTSADTIIPPTQGVQAWDRYAYVNNSPVMYSDPSGHCIDDDPANCWGGGGGAGGGGNSNSGSSGGEIVSLLPEGPACTVNYCGQPNNLPVITVPSYAGYSNPDLDAIYFFWEEFTTPIHGLVKMDDIYRMSSRGGWKAVRYSLNLGLFEAIVQGSRQAYRDSWYQNLTPTQRLGRPLLVGAEALVTDLIAERVGKGFRNAGFVVGGPLGAAAGHIAGQTYATKIMDRIWMEKINPMISPWLGVWP
ncbi:MAG: RHS repeat-associated core domain-containing protein [Anaerolineales bacterium]|nr:MAG: RHS repeat-associated core domain-containing protein [Anaerolineales bacterium]